MNVECNETNCTEFAQLNKLSNEEIMEVVKDVHLVSASVYRVLKRRNSEHLLEGKEVGFDHHAY